MTRYRRTGTHKTCSRCHLIRALVFFPPSTHGSADGLRAYCRDCDGVKLDQPPTQETENDAFGAAYDAGLAIADFILRRRSLRRRLDYLFRRTA